MQADLGGRLKKLKDVHNYKMPLLEAVANSIQAISQANRGDGKISVLVDWCEDKNLSLLKKGDRQASRKIKNITIIDNGIGFTNKNLESFGCLDSTYKSKEFGCLGVGRLLWLKAFEDVKIDSVYEEGNERFKRSFRFSVRDEVTDIKNEHVDSAERIRTEVRLIGLKEDLQGKKGIALEDVAHTILMHFLLSFALGKVPEIEVRDGEEIRNLQDEFRKLDCSSTLKIEKFDINGESFEFIQQKYPVKATKKLTPGVYLCAGDRVVCQQTNGIDPRIGLVLKKASGTHCLYIGLVKSAYLDCHVDTERKSIIFPNKEELEDECKELSFEPIEKLLVENINKRAGTYLEEEFAELNRQSTKRLQSFVDQEAPEFKGFVNHERESLFISSDRSDIEIWEYLSKEFYNYEVRERKRIRELISESWFEGDAETKIKEIEERMEPIASRDLVRFAAQRKFYLDMLHKAITYKGDGEKYRPENAVHSLIFPMSHDSSESSGMNKQNLWIIDDKLAFSHFLASDKSFKSLQILESQSRERMDIVALKLYSAGEAMSPGELYIVEFKRPGRNDYNEDKNPVSQVLDYIDEIRAGKVTAIDGTEISNGDKLPIFCYIVAQFTDKLKKYCRHHSFVENANGDCFFGYASNSNAYFEVMNFNALYRKARERNRAMLVAANLSDPPSCG